MRDDERDENASAAGEGGPMEGGPEGASEARSGGGARAEAHGREGTGSDEGGPASGWARGLGVLSAFKDALEEALHEARERGDLSTERAREVLGKAAGRAREATSDARERFDFVTRAEFDELSRRVGEMERRLRDHLGAPQREADAEGPDTGGGS